MRVEINPTSNVEGKIEASGSKNHTLMLLGAAALVAAKGGETLINNSPNITDVDEMCNLMRAIGLDVDNSHQNRIKVGKNTKNLDATGEKKSAIFKKIRTGILLYPAILSNNETVEIVGNGGCEIGGRPIEVHLDAIKRFGYEIEGDVIYKNRNNRGGQKIEYTQVYPSVTGTQLSILMCVATQSYATIRNIALESEIKELFNYIANIGVDYKFNGYREVEIDATKLNIKNKINVSIKDDRIETATYFAIAAGSVAADVLITSNSIDELTPVIDMYRQAGVRLSWQNNKSLRIQKKETLKSSINLVTGPWPAIPTDIQPMLSTLAIKAPGRSRIVENVYENRFTHLSEMKKLGVNSNISRTYAEIDGPQTINGGEVYARDLRCAAALLIAGVSAESPVIINNFQYAGRGYERIIEKCGSIGVVITEV